MNKCDTCKKGAEPVPYIVHESAMARQERTIKRLWILLLVLTCLLVGTNGLWIWYESQYASEYYDITQENDDGYNNFIGHDGDITNGKADDQGQKENP